MSYSRLFRLDMMHILCGEVGDIRENETERGGSRSKLPDIFVVFTHLSGGSKVKFQSFPTINVKHTFFLKFLKR